MGWRHRAREMERADMDFSIFLREHVRTGVIGRTSLSDHYQNLCVGSLSMGEIGREQELQTGAELRAKLPLISSAQG
jgi:hypothetical protein